MTVSTEVDHNEYIGNGVTTTFPYTFRIFQKSDLVVQVVDLNENITELILDTDYIVTGAGGYNGGNVILSKALVNGYQISISRELPVTQDTDLRNQGKFFAEVHEDAFDKLTMLIQQVRSWFSLALRKPSFVANYYDALNNYIRNLRDPIRQQDAATKNYVDSLASNNYSRTLRVPEQIPQLPDAATRANKIVAFDSAGNPYPVLPPSGSASDVLLQIAQPGFDKHVGSSWGGNSIWEDYPYKGSVKPSKVIYPSMNTTQIQSILSSAGQIYVSSGTYTTSTAWAIYPNTEIWWDPGATLYPANNNMTVMTCDPTISGWNGVRNVKLHNVRIDISGKTGCRGFVGIKFRNHGHLDMMWVNMGTAANNVGIEIGTLCYGLKVDGCEVIGGGTGSIRLLLRNGANAITVTGFNGYSGTPEIDMPQYGIIVRHGLNGETTWDYVNTFPTEAVVFVGGFSQNCSKYGFLDQAQGTKVYGMYFENNSSSDVRMSSSVGALFHRCTHSSTTAGLPANAYSASNLTLNALIDEPVYGSRAGGFFKIDGGSDATVTNIVVNINTWKSDQGITSADLGVLSSAKVNRNGVLQLSDNTVDINMGFSWYRRNVISGENISFTGTPYDGQKIGFILRGSNISSLSIAGVPVNVTGANTSQIKMTTATLVYSRVVSAWVMNTGEWNATA
ncbi:phage tail protein [Escherichia coli]